MYPSRKVRSGMIAMPILPILLLLIPVWIRAAGEGIVDPAREHVPLSMRTATWYVSPAGDDENPGTREELWASPGPASRRISGGDTLVVLGGTYHLSVYDEDIIVPPSGIRGLRTVIRGEEGDRSVLAGSGNLIRAVDLAGRSFVTIENLEITSDGGEPFREGISAVGEPSSELRLNRLFIHHVDEFGIDMGDVENAEISGCRISYCGFGSIGGPAGEGGGWRDIRIRECVLSWSGHYYQGGPGPGPYDRPDGFGIEPSAGPIEIGRTIVSHNRGDGIDSKARNTLISGCVVANNRCDGVKLWGGGSTVVNTLVYGRGDGDQQPSPWAAVMIGTDEVDAGFTLVNVTVDDSLGQNYLTYVQYDQPDVPIRLVVINSIFSGRGGNSHIFLGTGVDALIGRSLFFFPQSDLVLEHGSEDYGPGEVGLLGPGNIYGDPLFTNPAFGTPGDYHLLDGSPAIDAGTRLGAPPADLDCVLRPQGGGVDVGCYER